MQFNHDYHRVTFSNLETIVLISNILMFFIPLFIVIIIYSWIIKILMIKKHDAKNIYCISIPIVVTTIISLTPSLVVDVFSISMDYRWNHIITIFFFYTISLTDPIAILIGFPPIMRYLRCQGTSVAECDRAHSIRRWQSAGEEQMRSLAVIKAMQQVVSEEKQWSVKPTVIANGVIKHSKATDGGDNSEESKSTVITNNSLESSTVILNSNAVKSDTELSNVRSERVQTVMKAWARPRVAEPVEPGTPVKLPDFSKQKASVSE